MLLNDQRWRFHSLIIFEFNRNGAEDIMTYNQRKLMHLFA
jgi:hypothetical protein